jgi:predicted ribosome quality control (RQC) complex YloA/Tae2 family protein
VLVGRNDDENDTLSLKVAASDDIWFHAHGCPGSHVVLKKEGRKEEPSRQAVAEAAAVAAYWSKARGSSKVGVSYTRAKYVTKPKGAPSGTVTIRQEKLVTVPPALLPMEDTVKETET